MLYQYAHGKFKCIDCGGIKEEGGFQADVLLHSKSNPDMITVYPLIHT